MIFNYYLFNLFWSGLFFNLFLFFKLRCGVPGFFFILFMPSACFIFFYFFYLCCVFAVVAGGLVAGAGPPAVNLRRLLCLAAVLVACRASVAGSFGSCRACGQLSASSGWFWGSFCFGPGGRC